MNSAYATPELSRDEGSILDFLADPASYPDSPRRIEQHETHMSRVFLTERYAFKLKKPLILDFLDYSSLEKRREHCLAELRLNRRLAPAVYLGVVAVCRDARGTLSLDGPGEPVEWLVKMKRLPADGLLDAGVRAGRVEPARLEAVAELLAHFYRSAPVGGVDPAAYATEIERCIRADAEGLLDSPEPPDRARIERILDALIAFLEARRELLAARAARVVDGHGDLRPEHVFLGPPPAVIDCIEFNRTFRLNDPVDEIAFLDMECLRHGVDQVGPVFFRRYASICQDAVPAELVAFHRARRALLRAKLSLWHLKDDPPDRNKWIDRTAAYLELAESQLDRFATTSSSGL